MKRSLALAALLALAAASFPQAEPLPLVEFERAFDPAQHYQERAAAVAADDVYGRLELAELCRSLNLPDAMRDEAGKVIALDPGNRAAREMLRHAFVEGRWLLPEEAAARGLEEHEGICMSPKERREHLLRESWDHAWERRSGKFLLRTNTSRRKLEQFLSALAEFRDNLERTFGVDCTSRAEVHVFRSPKDYFEKGGGRPGTGGFYSPSERVLKLFDDPQDIRNTLRVLFHEGTHMFLNLTNKNKSYRNPIWLEEGLAEYYGSATWDYRKERYVWGNPLNDRIRVCHQTLGHPRSVSLEKLLVSPQAGYGGIHYAYGWTLVMYLSRDPETARSFGRYLREIRESRYAALYDNDPRRRQESLDLFQKLFLLKGESLQDFEKGWVGYIRGLKEVPGAPDFFKKFRRKDSTPAPGSHP